MNPVVGEQFDFNKYRAKNDKIQPKENVPQQESEEPFDFSQYSSNPKNASFNEAKRHIARTASRVGETLVGMPGDFVKFIQNAANSLPKPPEFLNREPSFVQELGQKGLEKLPQSHELKEFSEKASGGLTKAQGTGEEIGDEIVSLASLLFNPVKDPTKVKSLLGALGKASLAIGAGEGAELLGAGPKTKAATELGTLFLTGLIGKKSANQFVSEKYQNAKSKIPQGDIVESGRLVNGLDGLERELSRGISTPTKDEVLKPLKELREKAKGGGVLVEDLVQSYHDINEKASSKKLFDELSKPEKKILKHRYDLLKTEVNGAINNYGKRNPEFLKEWKEANGAYSTISRSKKVSKFLENEVGAMPKHLVGTLAFELLLGHPKLAAATLGAAGAVKSGELLYRIAKNPNLQRHYLSVIEAAGKENLPAVIKGMEAMNKEFGASKDQ